MSSPTVLTFVPMTLHEARETNRREAHNYLDLAQAVWLRANAKAKELRSKGVGVPDPGVIMDDARAKVEQLLNSGDGSEALRYAHAVYQRLKHPWAELVDKMVGDDAAQTEIARARADLAERERVAAIVQQLTLRCGLPPVEMLASAAGSSVEEMIAARLVLVVEIALSANPRRNVDALRDEIESGLAGVDHSAQKLAILDGLRVRMEDELGARTRSMALARVQYEQAEFAREALRIRTSALSAELGPLGEADETRFAADIARLAAAIGSAPEAELERQVDALREEIIAARARKSVYDLVVKTLRRQGYDEIEAAPSQALGPAAIRRRYFRRPGDVERLVEFAYGEDDALSVETVRLHDGSVETRQADREAQQELCSTMKRVAVAMDQTWRTVVVHEGAVGEAMAVRPDLALVAGRHGARGRVAGSKENVVG